MGFNSAFKGLTYLPQLSFAEASDRESTVLGMYIQCSSEKQVQSEKKKFRRDSFCLMVEASDHGYVLHTRRIHVTRYRI
jgi:hypothetical protein